MASTFQNGVMYACFAALALLACVCAFVGFRQVGMWLRARLCPISLVAFASAAIIATCDAQKRGNEAARAPLPRGEYTVSITPRSVGEAALLPLPGAVTNAKWRARGAFEDAFYIRATNWWARMPDGRWMDRLRILSSCGFRARGVGGGAWTNYPPPFTQKLSLAPEANWYLLGDATGGTPVVPVNGQDARSPSLFWHAMTIVEPFEVVSPNASNSGTFMLGTVGFGCLQTANYIGPFHVSFEGVKVCEVPCYDAIPPTGFFASPHYTGQLTHNFDAGAGQQLKIQANNYWRHDDVGTDIAINYWSEGTLVWKIPIGWKRFQSEEDTNVTVAIGCDYECHGNTNSRPLLIGGRADAYMQTFRIDSYGTTTLEKFGWRMTRSRLSFSGTVEKIE